MNFWQRIEKIRARPERERERIVFGTAFGITILLFGFWMYDFTTVGPVPGATPAEDAPSPWAILQGNVSAVIKDATGFFGNQSSATSTESNGN